MRPRNLVAYEESVGEEYVTLLHSTLKAFVETNPAVKKTLEDIAADEKRHAEILKQIVELSSKKVTQTRKISALLSATLHSLFDS